MAGQGASWSRCKASESVTPTQNMPNTTEQPAWTKQGFPNVLFLWFGFFFLIKIQLIYSVVSISALQHRDPVLRICIYTFFSHTISHHVLTQELGYSSLSCTAGPHCLSILNVILRIYQPQTPSPSHSLLPPPWQPQICPPCL